MITAASLLMGLGVVAAHAIEVRRPPNWVSKPPASDPAGTAYFVGTEEDAPSLQKGREAAFRDATQQIAAFLQTTVSQQFLSRRDQQQSSVIDKVASASTARLAGARIMQTYFEKRLSGRWPLRREVLSVWVLVGFPQNEVGKERARLQGLHKIFQDQITDICDDQARWVLLHARKTPVLVGGFREAAKKDVLVLSQVIEDELSGCLVSRGVSVATQGQGDGILSSGGYYRAAGGAIVITGFLARPNGTKLTAKSVSISDDAMGPGWLERVEVPTKEPSLTASYGDAVSAAPQEADVDSDKDQATPVVEGPTPGGGDYLDLVGGWMASSGQSASAVKSGSLLAHVHALKYVHFFRNGVVGIGSSMFETYWGPWKVRYRQTSPSGTQDFEEIPNVLTLCPIHLVIAPFQDRWLVRRLIGTPSLSYTFSAWGWSNLKHGPSKNSLHSAPWNTMIHNVSISLPIGNWSAIQGGFLSVRQPSFTSRQDGINQQAKPQTTTWTSSGFKHQSWYLGYELHFGGRL